MCKGGYKMKGDTFKMKIKEMELHEIMPYGKNPRFNERAVGVVMKSIQEFGFKNPIIVDKENVIIAGHTRYKASERLGIKKVPVIVADDLNEEQVKAFRIMDNKSSEFAEWDYVALLEEVGELEAEDYDIELTGFEVSEINDIIDEMEGEQGKKEEEERPEIEFTEELLEEHQYVVMYFDNTMDWQVAKELFKLSSKRALDGREGYERVGVGRVVKGADYLEALQKGLE